MKMKVRLSAAVAGAVMLVLGAAGSGQASSVPESTDPIKFAINEWTGQHLSAHIAGEILKRVGYNVEYVTAGAVPQFAAIAQGSLHVQPEVWTNNVGDIYPKAVADGDIVVVGSLGLEPRESLIYPPYMEEVCPGLPDYKALFDCAQAFATPETFPKGRLITYPADWGTREKELVDAIDLPFVPIAGGSEGTMIAELKSAYAAREPILMMFWAPHWLHAELEFNWVEWPAYEENCDTDPTVGLTSDHVNDCGFQQASIDKIVWKGFAEKWPVAYHVLEQFTLDNATQNRLMLEVDQQGRPIEEVVREWVEENKSIWEPWVDAATM
jgi:glycine betaine/proline transport system substrate-binding protein